MRVKDFTYYPLMSDTDCAFRVPRGRKAPTYHQCGHGVKETVEGYGFCSTHAARVKRQSSIRLEGDFRTTTEESHGAVSALTE